LITPRRDAAVTKPPHTVRELIRDQYTTLTQSERKFANSLLENYPAAGLASITIVASNADVSTPTVARMVQKLGFKGYPQFHQALLKELQAKVSGPTQRRANWASEAPEGHMLNRFSQAVTDNLSQTFSNVDSGQFDAAVRQLANTEARLYVVGGRITRALADYAFTHFQAIRQRVTHMTSSSATWPHYVLDMEAGDTLLMFDVAAVAEHTFNCWVEIPSAWDSNIATMMLLEAMIAATQEESWDKTKERYDRLDELFDTTRLFRKFS
jgi:DNA-binding MurR/RpiR family transcriptional regulator